MWLASAVEGPTPLDLVKYDPVFFDERIVREEAFHECRLDVANGLPVGRAEVSAECETNLKGQVFCEDIGERTHDVRVVLDLVKARLG